MTPKELMISRYEAFVKKDWHYLAQTSTSQTIQELEMMPELEWLKLDVLNAYENIVEFKAYYKENGKIAVLHEKSFFIEENGVWKYKDGELFNAKVERNEPCPCGSGKKFKKCCSNL
jgi:SEC-C motif-containing protein